MVVVFSKQNTNYNQQNIIDILKMIRDPTIQYLIRHPVDTLTVFGDIHNSQWTSDNPKNHYWFKIKGFSSTIDTSFLSSIHIYVCFRLYKIIKGRYIPQKCINPPMKKQTDIADISKLTGFWEFVRITYGHVSPIIEPSIKPKMVKKKSVLNPVKEEMMKKIKASLE